MVTLVRLFISVLVVFALVAPEESDARGRGTPKSNTYKSQRANDYSYSKEHSHSRLEQSFERLSYQGITGSDFKEAYYIFSKLKQNGTLSSFTRSGLSMAAQKNIFELEKIHNRITKKTINEAKLLEKRVKFVDVKGLIDFQIANNVLRADYETINLLPFESKEYENVFSKKMSAYDRSILKSFKEIYPNQNWKNDSSIVEQISKKRRRTFVVIGHHEAGLLKKPDGTSERLTDIAKACRASESACIFIVCTSCEYVKGNYGSYVTHKDISLNELRYKYNKILDLLEFSRTELRDVIINGPTTESIYAEYIRTREFRAPNTLWDKIFIFENYSNGSMISIDGTAIYLNSYTSTDCPYPENYKHVCACFSFFEVGEWDNYCTPELERLYRSKKLYSDEKANSYYLPNNNKRPIIIENNRFMFDYLDSIPNINMRN